MVSQQQATTERKRGRSPSPLMNAQRNSRWASGLLLVAIVGLICFPACVWLANTHEREDSGAIIGIVSASVKGASKPECRSGLKLNVHALGLRYCASSSTFIPERFQSPPTVVWSLIPQSNTCIGLSNDGISKFRWIAFDYSIQSDHSILYYSIVVTYFKDTLPPE